MIEKVISKIRGNIELTLDRVRSLEINNVITPCLSLTNVEVIRKISEHTTLKISGSISLEGKEAIKGNIGKNIRVFAFQNVGGISADVIFAGIIENIELVSGPLTSSFTIEAKSFSIELDRKKRKRSFQDIKKSYADIINVVETEGKYNEILRLIPSKKMDGEELGKLLIQYEETDWEFLKRIFSHLEMPLIVEDGMAEISDYTMNSEYMSQKKWSIWLGMPERSQHEFNGKSISEVSNHKESYIKSVMSGRFELGERINYYGTSYFIIEAHTRFIGNIIETEYKMVKKDAIKIIPISSNMIGKGILAEVIEIGTSENLTRVRVDFIFENTLPADKEYDENIIESKLKDNTRASWEKYWFRYSTSYSGTNSGIYMMPEVKDKVIIYFTNNNENSGYAGESIRMENTLNEDDPDIQHKRIMIPTGQQIILSEKLNKVRILGNKDRSVYIDTLTDTIDFTSGEAQGVLKNDGISFQIGDSKIVMNKDKLTISCGSSAITMDSGGKVDIKGS